MPESGKPESGHLDKRKSSDDNGDISTSPLPSPALPKETLDKMDVTQSHSPTPFAPLEAGDVDPSPAQDVSKQSSPMSGVVESEEHKENGRPSASQSG